jgi:hypothetical protein
MSFKRRFLALTTLALASVSAYGCSASPDSGGAVAEEQEGIHFCPLFIRRCPLDETTSCRTENGCPVCGCIQTLVSGAPDLIGVALDDTNVYWGNISTATVNAIPKGGGTVTSISTGGGPDGVAVAGSNVYWLTGGGISEAPVGGGATTVVATEANLPYSLAVDGTNVYWGTANGGYVVEKSLAGGPAITITKEGAFSISSIAVDSANIYWLSTAAQPSQTVYLQKAPIGGGAVVTLSSADGLPAGLAVNGGNVYFGIGSALMTVPTGGGATATLATTPTGIGGVATDGASVYWIGIGTKANSYRDATVMRVPVSGGSAVAVARDLYAPQGDAVAVDSTSVYWTTYDGKVQKLTPK